MTLLDWLPYLPLIIVVLAVWEVVWKGIGLWRAARNNHTAWFVLILVFNTVGILPIIYILTAGKKK